MTDTIVAPATAPGRAALGVVRVSGPGARRVARELLGLEAPVPRRAVTRPARRGEILIDRVVAVFWEAPDTPTGEDLLEISAHGSPEIIRELVDAAVAYGARVAEPGEFTRRAFLNGRLDLAQAQAVGDLIAARGARARTAALARLEGGLARAVAAVRAPILDLLAELEARLDHPDEDLPTLSAADAARRLEKPSEMIARLIAARDRGRDECSGLRVCLVGRPNAGKSSLLNAWLGRDRAIVSAQPGTTRDLIEAPAEIEGLAATLIDTAGLRDDAADEAEREGVVRAERALASCDVAVLVVDAACPDDEAARAAARRALSAAARAGRPVVSAWNKCDLAPAPEGGLAVSALTGAGLAELSHAVAAAAGAAPGDEGEELLVGARERAELTAAREELSAARGRAEGGAADWEPAACAHLREAHHRLGRVLGEDAPDEVLHAVFARFCVGK